MSHVLSSRFLAYGGVGMHGPAALDEAPAEPWVCASWEWEEQERATRGLARRGRCARLG